MSRPDEDGEANDMRAEPRSTLRSTVPTLEEIIYKPFPVLDHGFVRVVDYMGDDAAVVQAARVSYGRGTRKASEDRGLINYLLRNRHTTPFEMAEIKLHVKLPIFVARQWIRHRTANVNEYSARYSVLDNEFYIPDASNLAAQSDTNKQGRAIELDHSEASEALEILKEDARRAYANYLRLLNTDEAGVALDNSKSGLARELARMNLSLNFYTQWYWKTDLHNLMNFLQLRVDPHAQYEIRVYAEIMLEILKRWVPLTHEAFLEHRLHAKTLSATAVKALQAALRGEKITQTSSGLPAREWSELAALFAVNKD